MSKKEKKESTSKSEKKKKKSKWKKVILIIFLLFILLMIIGAGVAVGVFFGMFGDELQVEKDDLLITTQNSKVVDSEGNVLAVLAGDEKRQIISIDDMTAYLPKAYVAIEDERFYQHHGVDVARTGKAILTFIANKGSSSFGGSTITQQLVKNITKEDDDSGIEGVLRKIKEWARAYNLENMLSKPQILELYLNILFVGGPGLHGVEMGSQYYFDKNAKDLSLAECAFLAGINHSPNAYNPFNDDEEGKIENKIKIRAKTVLAKMLELGYITEQTDYDEAVEQIENGLEFKKGNITTDIYSYHTEAAINQVIQQYMKEKGASEELAKTYVYGSGLTIYTTQVKNIQERMEEEFKRDKWMVSSRKDKDKKSQAAMVIIDHKTGYVVGTVGGTGEKTTSFGLNRATQSTRQTGSSMKPIAVIAPALDKGIITAGTVYDDVQTTFGKYTPKNYYGGFKGLSTIRYAIEISQNIIPVKIMSELGSDTSIKYLKDMGITSIDDKKDQTLSLALGGLTYGVSPLEMAGAYAMIANDGVYIEPTFYTKVEDANGKEILTPKQTSKRVLSKENAYVLKSILTSPVTGTFGGATATICRISKMDVAAKTGTTTDDFDRWLCGFTPYYTAATWFGYDTNETIHGVGGINPSSVIWSNIMKDIHKNLESKKFEQPDGIVRVAICKSSGLLPNEYCKDYIGGNPIYTEVFVKGTQPSKTCDCHVKAKVCEVKDGQYELANEYCPDTKELVFITRPNADKNNSWKKAGDAKYMLPTVTCTRHEKPVEEPIPDPGNNMIDSNNTITNDFGNNTVIPPDDGNTMTNETTGNNINNNTTNNTSNNTISGNNTITNSTIQN